MEVCHVFYSASNRFLILVHRAASLRPILTPLLPTLIDDTRTHIQTFSNRLPSYPKAKTKYDRNETDQSLTNYRQQANPRSLSDTSTVTSSKATILPSKTPSAKRSGTRVRTFRRKLSTQLDRFVIFCFRQENQSPGQLPASCFNPRHSFTRSTVGPRASELAHCTLNLTGLVCSSLLHLRTTLVDPKLGGRGQNGCLEYRNRENLLLTPSTIG